MGNNYTAIPNIIPGNLTVNGRLTVLGNELRVGSVPSYIRLYTVPPTACYITFNLASDGVTQDDPTRACFYESFDTGTQQFSLVTRNSAGAQTLTVPRRAFWADHNPHTITGTIANTTVASKTIAAGQLGPAGGILVRVTGSVVSVAGGGLFLYLSWGGILRPILSIGASVNAGWWTEAIIVNQQVTGTQVVAASGQYGLNTYSPPSVTTTVDTTVSQPLSLVATPLNTADVVNIYSVEADAITASAAL